MDLESPERLIADIVRSKPCATDEQISTQLKVSRRTVARLVSKLKQGGRFSVQRIRYKVGGNWVNQRVFKEIS